MSVGQDMSPNREIMAFAIKELTKEWTTEKQQEFSKYCFDTVCKDRYIRLKKVPTMNMNIIKQ